jgi:hypothetical protein
MDDSHATTLNPLDLLSATKSSPVASSTEPPERKQHWPLINAMSYVCSVRIAPGSRHSYFEPGQHRSAVKEG